MQNGISIFIKLRNILRIFINIKNITIVMISVSFSGGSTDYLSTLRIHIFFFLTLHNSDLIVYDYIIFLNTDTTLVN